ncbi:hypothetical protein [Streptomonospora salina]|uniref:Uncharacterized protein n=1 Tax=Streptomonospora salina TaxID=104205 RepID=A0A841EN63_9ACTN|nr:hypothetical protein [Streptomonospora salina]MBB6000861.1 hypothetical protein [Streptomonospora salina]
MDQKTKAALAEQINQARAEFVQGIAGVLHTIKASLCGADVDGQPCVRPAGHVGPHNYRWPGGLPEEAP